MGAKLVVKEAEIELTGGAKLRFGVWVVQIKNGEMVAVNGDTEITFRPKSNGWIDYRNDYYTGTLFSCGIEGHRTRNPDTEKFDPDTEKFDINFCKVKKSG